MQSSARLRKWLGLGAILCIVGIVYIRSAAQVTRLPAPVPVPAPRHGTGLQGLYDVTDPFLMRSYITNPAQLIMRDRNVSLLLAQVISVQPAGANVPNQGGYPVVKGGRFQVIETLDGPPIVGTLDVINTLPRGFNPLHFGPPPPEANVMRNGELWILFYHNQRREINPDSSFWLTEPADPVLSDFRVHQAWMRRQDGALAMLEMERAVQNAKLTYSQRFTALLTLQPYSKTPSADAASAQAKMVLYKKIVTDLFADGTLPANLGQQVVRMAAIDLTHELKPDSYDTLQLQALLNIVANSRDDQCAGNAASKLISVVDYQVSPVDRPVIYFCPEIVKVLEEREAADSKSGKINTVGGILSNLHLAGGGSLQEIAHNNPNNQAAVVIRKIPPIGDSEIARKIVAASRK